MREGAPAGGTGTASAPFATIGDALAVAAAGVLVVVGAGTYDEAVTLPASVSLRGACARDTRIAHSTRDTTPATVRVVGAGVTVSDVQLGGARVGLLVDAGGVATITGVLVDRATETGLRVHRGGRATIRDLVVARTITDPDDHQSAFGIVVELAGVATAQRVVVSDTKSYGIILDGSGSELTVDDVAVLDTGSTEGSATYGVGAGAQAGAHLTLHGAVVERAHVAGLSVGVAGATVDADDVVLRSIAADGRGTAGAGVLAASGGVAHLRRVLVEQAIQGVRVESGASVDAEDVVLRTLAGDPAFTAAGDGEGIAARNSTITASRVWIEHAGYFGVGVVGAGSGRFTDVTVRACLGGLAGDGGAGVVVQGGAAVEVTRARFEHNREVSANAAEAGSSLRLTDVSILETAPRSSDAALGRGIASQSGAAVEVERVLVRGSTSVGVIALTDATLSGTDLEIRDTRAGEGGRFVGVGIGLDLQVRASATLRRVRIGESRGFGVKADFQSGPVLLEDLWVHDTERWDREPAGRTTVGRGIDTVDSAVTIARAIVERSREFGIFAARGSLELSDVVVRDTRGEAVTGEDGIGLLGVDRASVAATDVLLERNRDTSLYASSDAHVTASRIRIVDTLARACAATTCTTHAAGVGVSVVPGGAIELSDFTVSRAVLCGVQVAGGQLDLHRGRVEGSPIGANVQDVGYDIARLTDMVVFADNDRNLDSASLPTPDSAMPIELAEGP